MIAYVEVSGNGGSLEKLESAQVPEDILHMVARQQAYKAKVTTIAYARIAPAALSAQYAMGWCVGEVKIFILADQEKFGGQPLQENNWYWQGADAAEFGLKA